MKPKPMMTTLGQVKRPEAVKGVSETRSEVARGTGKNRMFLKLGVVIDVKNPERSVGGSQPQVRAAKMEALKVKIAEELVGQDWIQILVFAEEGEKDV